MSLNKENTTLKVYEIVLVALPTPPAATTLRGGPGGRAPGLGGGSEGCYYYYYYYYYYYCYCYYYCHDNDHCTMNTIVITNTFNCMFNEHSTNTIAEPGRVPSAAIRGGRAALHLKANIVVIILIVIVITIVYTSLMNIILREHV